MKAKFLSVLLALTMVLSLLPTAALAVDKTVSTEEELKQAIESVSDGDTITVSGTIEVNAPLVVTHTITLTVAALSRLTTLPQIPTNLQISILSA